MQLKEIKSILDRATTGLSLARQEANKANSTYYLYRDVDTFRRVIDEISKTNLFADILNDIKNSDLYSIGGSSVYIDPGTAKSFEEKMDKLRVLVQEFARALTPLVGETDDSTINIRLPHVGDFQDLADTCNDLQIALAQVIYNEEIKGTVKIVSVENGSIWFAVSLGTTYAVRLVGYIVNAATKIHSVILNNRILSSQARVANIDADRHQFLAEQEEKLISLYLEIETDQIKREFFKNPDGEISERIKNSIRLVNELMNKNVEIKPSLATPDDVKKGFPTLQQLESIEQTKHLLEGQKAISDKKVDEP